MRAPGGTSLALLPPRAEAAARWRRLSGGAALYLCLVRRAGSGSVRRAYTAPVGPEWRPRLEADPLLRRARWVVFGDPRGDGGEPAGVPLERGRSAWLSVREARSGRELELRVEKELTPPTRAVPPPSALKSFAGRIAVPWPAKARTSELCAEGLWIPNRHLGCVLRLLAQRKDLDWSAARIRTAAGGVLLAARIADPPPGAVPVAQAPLSRRRLWIETRLDVPPSLTCHFARAASDTVAVVDRGTVELHPLDGADLPLWSLLSPRARIVRAETRCNPPPSGAIADLRSERARRAVLEWLAKGGREAPDNLETQGRNDPESAAGPDSPKPSGWRRFFTPRLPSAALRKLLQRRSLARLADESTRDEVVERQVAELSGLLDRLSGPDWRKALGRALPLVAPRDPALFAAWLNTEARAKETGTSFSLDLLERKGSEGRIPVGGDIYRRLEALYRRAAERLLARRLYREAAHVYAYLLGDYERAGGVLESGGFAREAATVYYHLAGLPRRAAAALDRGGLPEEAARLWMELGEWRRAAESWHKAGNELQERAAWRKVASDHRDRGEPIAAARILERELSDVPAALDVLEGAIERGSPMKTEIASALVETAGRAGGLSARTEAALALTGRWLRELRADRPRRTTWVRLLDWADRLLAWSDAGEVAAEPATAAAHELFLEAASTWAELLESAPQGRRAESALRLRRTAKRLGERLDDPWLSADTSAWLRNAAPPPGKPVLSPGLGGFLGARGTSLAVRPPCALAGDAEGKIHVLEGAGGRLVEIGLLDTGTSRPVEHLAVRGEDVYAASGTEVHHFELPENARKGFLLKPIQTETSLPGRVEALLLSEDGSLLLRAGGGEVRALDPVHLQPAREPLPTRAGRPVALAVNRRYAACLLLGATEPAAPPRVEVFERRKRELARLESFPVAIPDPRRLAFERPETDVLVAVCDAYLVRFPARRTAAQAHELLFSSRALRLPPPCVWALPRGDGYWIAYGDGTLERLDKGGNRTILREGRPARDDRLVAFVPRRDFGGGWALFASGRLEHWEAE